MLFHDGMVPKLVATGRVLVDVLGRAVSKQPHRPG